jgi:hypothetical protein
MKTWENCQISYLSNHNGQSLVELASFGAVLLLCVGMLLQYGMQANYQQNLQMQTFRKAMRVAYYKTGPGSSVSLSSTYHKGIPDPRDSWGNADRRPISASASVTWDNNLQSMYIDEYGEAPRQSDLARSIIEIDNIDDAHNTLGLSTTDIDDGAIDNIDSNKGAFKTADYGEGGCSGSITIVLENSASQRIALREEYRRVVKNCSEIKVKNRKTNEDDIGKEYAYVKIDGLQQTVGSADVDRDGELETIIAVRGTQVCDSDGYCGGISSFKYIDDQSGEINNECAMIYPWETEKIAKCNGSVQQGLIPEYNMVKIENNRMVKIENTARLDTNTNLGGSQEVNRMIVTNSGVRPYRSVFQPLEADFNMGATK